MLPCVSHRCAAPLPLPAHTPSPRRGRRSPAALRASAQAFALLRPLQPPTGVEHAVFAHLTGASEPNLVTARRSGIDVYDIDPTQPQHALSLVASFELAGSVQSLQAVRFSGKAARAVIGDVGSGGGGGGGTAAAGGGGDVDARVDVLLVSLLEAKVTMLAWDPFSRQLMTVGMLNFEDGASGVGSGVRGHRRGKHPVGYTAVPTLLLDPKQA